MARLRGDRFRRSHVAAPETLHFFTGRKQLVKRSFGLDLAVFEHDDMVGTAQSRPPVRHDQARQALGAGGQESGVGRRKHRPLLPDPRPLTPGPWPLAPDS